MTDKEIIKALKCCCNTGCENCGLFDVQYCDNYLHQQCVVLINRKQAEIERLEKETEAKETMIGGTTYIDIKSHFRSIEKFKAEIDRYKGVIKLLENDVKNSKAEAIKEFAEKVKDNQDKLFNYIYSEIGFCAQINRLVKEMVGE